MKLLTPEIVGKRLDVSDKTVIRHIKAGKLKGLKIGKLWKVSEESYQKYLQDITYQSDN